MSRTAIRISKLSQRILLYDHDRPCLLSPLQGTCHPHCNPFKAVFLPDQPYLLIMIRLKITLFKTSTDIVRTSTSMV